MDQLMPESNFGYPVFLSGRIISGMQPRRFNPGSESPRKFNVVVAFDSAPASSSSAMRTCDYVISQLGGDIPVRRRVVNLERATNPRSRAAAARDAAHADMVIVSTREGAEIPAQMKAWLDDWTGQRATEEGALVAIINRAAERRDRMSSAVRDQLAHIAEQMHMDFFSSEVAAP
jgi:hypothetical protein